MAERDNKLIPELRRIEAMAVGALVVGAAVTVFWMARHDFGRMSRSMLSVHPLALAGTIALSLLHLSIRWTRWHLFLRRSQIRIPTRYSVEVFLYGLMMILTPAYAGECLKALPIKARFGIRARRVVAVVVAERLFDVLALVAIWAMVSRDWRFIAVVSAIVLLLLAGMLNLVVRAGYMLDRARQLATLRSAVAPATDALKNLLSGYNLLLGLALSLIAWTAGGLALGLLSWGVGQQCSLPDAAAMFSRSTLLGALTLLPGGVGVTGSSLLLSLKQHGFPGESATATVFYLRLLTLWFAVGLGVCAFLYGRWKSKGSDHAAPSDLHFDRIASVYDADIPAHVRDHIVRKKTTLMLEYLRSELPSGASGLDMGCGRGWYMAGVGEVGYRVTGMDLSAEQASATRRLLAESGVEARVFVGNVSRLPLSDEQFDFAYSINVFHHLETLEDQVEALREAARVIRPGGLFFLHEINVTNQLFRFHMNYVFPLIHDIDEGTERWIKPKAVPDVPGLTLAGVEYLTFVPDFVPKSLFRLALPIENRLERSFLKSWSAHYMAVFRRT